jgi:hypothetical protein
VNDEAPLSPYVYEGLDPVGQPKPPVSIMSDAVKQAIALVGDAVEAGKKPGRPLGILSNVAREAPLGSLLIAFLLGLTIGRRRSR